MNLRARAPLNIDGKRKPEPSGDSGVSDHAAERWVRQISIGSPTAFWMRKAISIVGVRSPEIHRLTIPDDTPIASASFVCVQRRSNKRRRSNSPPDDLFTFTRERPMSEHFDERQNSCQVSRVQGGLSSSVATWQTASVPPREKKSPPPGFPTRLDRAMKRKDVSSSELERLTDRAGSKVSNSTISRYLSGDRTPQSEQLAALAKALDVSVDHLLGTSDAEPDAESSSSDLPVGLRDALDTYPWPEGLATKDVAAISDALKSEAFAHRNSYIPAGHWRSRIAEELAAKRGKRQERRTADEADEPDSESPEVAEYKAKKRKR